MHICLDIDDTITYVPALFRLITQAEVTVITFRAAKDHAVETLTELGVRYDRMIVSSDPEIGKRDDETCPRLLDESLQRLPS